MSYLQGDIIDEELDGSSVSWNAEDSKIGKDIVVITKDTEPIWKKGDSTKLFNELDSIYDTNKFNEAKVKVNILNPDISALASGRIAKVGLFLEQTAYHHSVFDLVFEDGRFYDTCSVTPIKISGSIRKRYGTILKLFVDSFSSYLSKGVVIKYYEWILPNLTILTTVEPKLEYTISDDPNLVGSNLTFRVRAFDEFDNRSAYSVYTVLISEDDIPIITDVTFEKIT